LGQTATAVEWLPGSVRVTARSTDDADHSFAARQVIVTLPIGVLKAEPPAVGAVRWQPEVPGLRTVLAQFEMGPVVKLLFEFREPFWHAGPLAEAGFIHVPHEPFPTWWTTAPLVGNRLTGWSGGPRAAALSGLSSTEIIRIGLETLARTFSRTVAELHEWVAEAEVCDWQLDPFSRGAYSYVRAGGFEAAQRLAEPIANTVFFAGEATHLEMNGTVAGAIESGYRAASAALRA
jgi:monoamine oxidase